MKTGFVFMTVLAIVTMVVAGCAVPGAPSPTPAPSDSVPAPTPAAPAPSPGPDTPVPAPTPGPATQPPSPGSPTGTLTVLVTDAPSYEVVNVAVHFLRVEVHKAADGPEGDGVWEEIPLEKLVDDQTFFEEDNTRKIELNADMGEVVLAQDDQVEAGSKYTQIRVYMEEGEEKGATVTYIPDPDVLDDNDEPITKTVDAKLPSGKLRFVRPFVVEADTETRITLDFDLQKSVVFTGASQSDEVKVIVKPVVKLSVSEKGKPAKLEATLEVKDEATATAELSTEEKHTGRDSVHLETTGSEGNGDEARIVIPLPEGTELGDIESISWWVWTVAGYPPHVDIVMDVDGDTTLDAEDMLTAEMAYNNDDGVELDEGLTPTTGEWLQTFELASDDGYGEINNDTMLWVTKMGAGNDDAPWGTLADWKDGVVANDPGSDGLADDVITGDAPVLRLEIEIDNWVLQTEAYVDDIEIVIDDVTYTVSL